MQIRPHTGGVWGWKGYDDAGDEDDLKFETEHMEVVDDDEEVVSGRVVVRQDIVAKKGERKKPKKKSTHLKPGDRRETLFFLLVGLRPLRFFNRLGRD